MVDPTTVNTSLAIPIRGTNVGTWDLPVNGNFNLIDSMFGGITTIALTSANVTLLSSQGQQSVVRFTGTLNNNVGVILSAIIKGWTIDNRVVNSPSSFAVFLYTPGASYALGVPPGVTDVFYDGSMIDYRNIDRVGTYVDFAGGAVPTWASGGTKPPYLICNGTTFSSATYPQLANLLGTTTLPDARGRVRMMSNLGTSRVTIFNGDTLFLGGGDQQVQAHTHTGSGNATQVGAVTGGVSANHTHTGSGTTSAQSADHTHTGSGTTSTVSADHTHTYSGTTGGMNSANPHSHANQGGGYAQAGFDNGGQVTVGTNAAFGLGSPSATATTDINHTHSFSGTTSGISANHTHTYSFTTSGVSVGHTHTYSFTTAIESADHTHSVNITAAYSFTTSSFGAGASLNMQPTYVGGITMIRAG